LRTGQFVDEPRIDGAEHELAAFRRGPSVRDVRGRAR